MKKTAAVKDNLYLNIQKVVFKKFPTLHFNLERHGGVIELRATDEDGNEWVLLGINSEGKVQLYDGVLDDIGLEVDDDGRLVIEEGDPF